MRPWLLRPPFLGSGLTSDFSGVVRVISTKSATEEPRRPGVVGLYLRIAMSVPYLANLAEDVEGLTGTEGDDGALDVLALARTELGAAHLALAVNGVDREHLDAKDFLNGDLDLGLVRAGVHLEGVLALVHERVTLLRHDGSDQDVAGVLVDLRHVRPPRPQTRSR